MAQKQTAIKFYSNICYAFSFTYIDTLLWIISAASLDVLSPE